MKIVHVCFSGVVTDGFSYQENLLSKFHVKQGHSVSLITSEWIFNTKGEVVKTDCVNYINEDGVHVIRLKMKKETPYSVKFKSYSGLFKAFVEEAPEIIFVHCPQFLEMPEIVRYAKTKSNLKIYVDNHADFSNSGRNLVSKYLLHGILWRHMVQIIEPYTVRFYGVLPARVEFLKSIYKLPPSKCELLVMGGDDELVFNTSSDKAKIMIRKEYGIDKKDFLIVTGGKIDKFKKQTLLLMQAVKQLEGKVKLLVFGSVDNEIKTDFDSLCDGEIVQYTGWIDSVDSYKFFAASDLVIFPGRHSVFWEQVVSQQIPMVCKYWSGTTHIDIGGNVLYLIKDSVDELVSIISSLVEYPDKYAEMLSAARGERSHEFLYSEIAKRSIL